MKAIKNNLVMIKYVFKFVPIYAVISLLYILASAFQTYLDIKIIEIVISLITKQIANQTSDFSAILITLIIYMVLLIICLGLIGVYQNYLRQRCRHVWVKKFQKVMFEKSRTLDIACYDNPEIYDKYSRALKEGDVKGIDSFDSVVYFIRSFANILTLSGYILFKQLPILFVVVIAQAVISFAIYSKVNKVYYKTDKKLEKCWRKNSYFSRTFYLEKNASDIKTTQIDDLLIEKLKENYETLKNGWVKTERKLLFLKIFEDFFYQLVNSCFSYVYLLGEIYFHNMSIELFASMIIAATRFSSSFYGLARNFVAIGENSLYIDDVLWLLQYEPTIEEYKGIEIEKVNASIDINNVSFSYVEGEPILKNINMHIKPKEHIAIIGYNGAGKTTLIKLLLKFYHPVEGNIKINNIDYQTITTLSLRENYSSIFQNFQIYCTTIKENILMRESNSLDDDELVWDALKKVELYEKVKGLPKQLDTILTKEFSNDGVELSGGERQRLALARIFVSDAKIVILDEPTSSLDPLAEYEINKRILENCIDKTVILISHRLSTVIDADTIYTLIDGEIVEKGTHKELMQKKGKYAEMFKVQSELYLNNNK